MKKVMIALGSVVVLILAAAFLVPILFKDQIKDAVDEELAKSINAEVYFEDFGITLFSDFPRLTVSLEDFGVINRAPFEGEVLMGAQSFKIIVDLNSLIFSETPRIKGIRIVDLKTNIIVHEDGTANYDITYPSEESVPSEQADETATQFSVGIDKWELVNAHIRYHDLASQLMTEIKGLNHSGSGDFTQDIFDLTTATEIEELDFALGGDQLLSKKQVAVTMTLEMNLPESKYSFKDNSIRLNDFQFGFDGFVAMPGEDIEMDLTFAAQENSFKSILSLVPGMFTESFEDIQTTGNLEFAGMVKGIYNETTMPAFRLALQVKDAMFRYPELPTPVSNISLDLLVDNKDGVIENTMVDIQKFHMDMGTNPVDAKILIKDLVRYNTEANISAKLNLQELNQMFPMEGLDMKGTFHVDLDAKGVYDSVQNIIPAINLEMALVGGFIQYSEYPVPLEDIHFRASVVNQSGKMAETIIKMDDFNMIMEGEKLGANMVIQNLDDYQWDVHVHGGVDLAKLTKIFPQEGMTLSGKIEANVDTKGKMSDIEAEKYDRLPTKGTLSLTDFKFESPDLPQGFGISFSQMTFDPGQVHLDNFQGTVGKSDMNLKGYLSNYIGYLFGDDQVLKGQLEFVSKTFDLNEWMTDEQVESDDSGVAEDSTALEVIEVPRNMDFVLNSTIDRVLYDNMVLNNLTGLITVKDGRVRMEGMNFNTLNGSFGMAGTYDTRDIQHPKFDFDFKIKELSIGQAYQTFNTIQTMAPIARKINGNFSTDFSMSGELGQDMMPNYSTLSGKGLVEVAKATVSGSKILAGVASLTRLSLDQQKAAEEGKVLIENLMMQTEIMDGKLNVKPFDVMLGSYKATIAGSNSFDGAIDYSLRMDIPAGEVGETINNALATLTGTPATGSSTIKLNLGITGAYDDPKVQIIGADTQGAVKQAARETLKKEVSKQVQEKFGLGVGGDDAPVTTEEAKEEAEKLAEEEAEKLKQEAEKKAQDEVESLKREAKEKLKKLFGN